ncbi:MAG TPA: hypothetical protein VER33_03115 [Polyangiaceae bacterium]|nr:hypothetical protein [Polyangiaceae bacterium]
MSPTAELRAHADGWVVLFWYEHQQGPLVRTLMRVETCNQRIAKVRNYFFAPEVIRQVCAELAVPCAVNGYRYWQTPG